MESPPQTPPKKQKCGTPSQNLSKDEMDRIRARHRVKQLQQIGCTQLQTCTILKKEGYKCWSLSFVKKYRSPHRDTIQTLPRSGRPTVWTPKTKKIIKRARGTKTKPLSTLQREIKHKRKKRIGRSTISTRYTKKYGLKSLKKSKKGHLTPAQRRNRFKWSKNDSKYVIDLKDDTLWTDEKYWELGDGGNLQNKRVRVKSVKNVPAVGKKKFPKKIMCWGGLSSRGLTKLIWLGSRRNVNTRIYMKKVLRGEVARIAQRTDKNGPINKRKLFNSKYNWYYQHDHASAHKSNAVDVWLKQQKFKHFKIMKRDVGNPFYLPPCLDDLAPVERLWLELSNDVNVEPYPQTVEELKRRVNKAWRNITPSFCTKIMHEIPARVHRIKQLKGEKIERDWRASSSKFACQCDVCKK